MNEFPRIFERILQKFPLPSFLPHARDRINRLGIEGEHGYYCLQRGHGEAIAGSYHMLEDLHLE